MNPKYLLLGMVALLLLFPAGSIWPLALAGLVLIVAVVALALYVRVMSKAQEDKAEKERREHDA